MSLRANENTINGKFTQVNIVPYCNGRARKYLYLKQTIHQDTHRGSIFANST